jgi:hypothetical protein
MSSSSEAIASSPSPSPSPSITTVQYVTPSEVVELLAEHNEDPVHSGVTIIDVRDEGKSDSHTLQASTQHCHPIAWHALLHHHYQLIIDTLQV